MKQAWCAAVLVAFLPFAAVAEPDKPVTVKTVHALSLKGEPEYGPDFTHFGFANPDAPKGGDVRMFGIGAFDNLNPYIVAGVPTRIVGVLVYEQLLADSIGEMAAEYALIAESVTYPSDYGWVEFNLNPKAKWHDGTPITPEDVIFSFNILTTEGSPQYAFYYANVTGVEKTGDNTVKFTFDQSGNRELPLIMGQLPVLPKHYWEGRDFDAPTLDPPLGSGPYRVSDVRPGRSITLERVRDYWGKDLPVNKGMYNFDTITVEYFLDQTVALEAFKKNDYDFRSENTARRWATEYDFPAVRDGKVIKEAIPHERPTGMQAFVFNTRKPIFSDPRVREAIALAFDFEWTNRTLFHDQYARTESYFSNSDLASSGLPSDAELVLLEPFRDQLPEAVFTTPYVAPQSDGSGNNRENLRKASMLLREAGYTMKNGKQVGPDGKPLTFEIMLVQPDFERIVLPFVDNLGRLGIDVTVRIVDVAQYRARFDDFDFDMVINTFPQSTSPGNEQRDFWGSETADLKGSRNIIGVKDPVVDALIDKIIFAPDREALVTATRALDRVLLHSHYVVPQWYIRDFRIAYWDHLKHPETMSTVHHGFPYTWWIEE